MGQQQLILLVLATVIVGIAIVVGIAAFTENSARANADALMQDAVRMANDAQATVKKPAPFGGVATLANVTFSNMGYPNEAGIYSNLNGAFTVTVDGAGLRFDGYGGDGVVVEDPDPNVPPVVDPDEAEQHVVVVVCGPSDADISGAILVIGEQETNATVPTC